MKSCLWQPSDGSRGYYDKWNKSDKNKDWGLPWWRSDWKSACQCRGHGFVPRSGRIPHAVEQLGPWATTTEPARLEPVFRNGRGRDSERPAHRDEEWSLLAATGESPCTETKTQHSQKINKLNKKKKKSYVNFPIKSLKKTTTTKKKTVWFHLHVEYKKQMNNHNKT